MQPPEVPIGSVPHEPRIGGVVHTLEEEEELQLALTILRMKQRLREPARRN